MLKITYSFPLKNDQIVPRENLETVILHVNPSRRVVWPSKKSNLSIKK